MLTTQSATPADVLRPFVQCYVQRVSRRPERSLSLCFLA